jgi:thioredoxin reductase (NADPH)
LAAGPRAWPRRCTAPPRACATLVIEREAPGGQAGTSSKIENYLGFPGGVSGDELARRALQQARRLGAEIVVTRVVPEIDPGSTPGPPRRGDSVPRAHDDPGTGVEWRRLTVDGAERLIGKGVYYGAARSETGGTQGLDIHLIGAGNSAGQAALHFANHARRSRSSSVATRWPRACRTT